MNKISTIMTGAAVILAIIALAVVGATTGITGGGGYTAPAAVPNMVCTTQTVYTTLRGDTDRQQVSCRAQ